ncbi:MAG: cation diffusion facilitator family transporter [Defluviitaleaceae bacterium]|nr:cation diffusion facilitator family transporter [Defluviitaleaceae bacterium]
MQIDSNKREAYGRRSGIIGIVLNFCLFAMKLVVGIFTGSVAVMADAVNNLSDAANSVVTLIAFKVADKPADKEHPFGHGRIEDIAGLIIAISILLLGAEFIRSSVTNIISPPEMDASISAISFLAVGFFVKLWMYFYNRRLARAIDSDVLMVVAKDSRNDCFINIATIVSLIAISYFDIYIDGYMGILISLVLLHTGFTATRGIFTNIIGKPIDKKTADAIIDIVMSNKEIIGTHDLVVHNYGPRRNVATIHAEVPASLSIIDAHAAIDAAEAAVQKLLGIALTIHLDPIETENELLNSIKNAVQNFLAKQCPKADAHEFRFVEGIPRHLLIFELELPHGILRSDSDSLVDDIKELITEICADCEIKINLEFGYVAKE